MLYLIHLEKKIHHAQHYMGCTQNLRARLREHAKGNGAKILARAKIMEIEWRVVRLWQGGYGLEKIFKEKHNGAQFCPVCHYNNARLFNKMDEFPLELCQVPLKSKDYKNDS